MGNEFFEYKKYDTTFSSLRNEFKSIDLQQIKVPNKINLNSKLYFILKPGNVEPGGSIYAVDVYEIISQNKKIGTLTDEFYYYQSNEVHNFPPNDHYLSIKQGWEITKLKLILFIRKEITQKLHLVFIL
ncbi:MAG: hypothetical protein PV340_01185 [Wolbachia sp.]|nr:hypothetical protein [Wolbachia sp.]MDD9336386.1 hypothetical protein [Wolbachia sp.]